MRRTIILCGAALLASCSFTLDTRGKPCTDTSECSAGQACRAQWCEPAVGDGDQCSVRVRTRCVDGNVHSFNSCDEDEGEVAACSGAFLCRDLSSTEAECACNNHWQGDSCDVCPSPYDPDKNCNECLAIWNPADNCAACATNRDITQSCTACVGNWDVGQNCTACLPGYDYANSCDTCLEHRAYAEGCAVCEGNWDINQECEACRPGYDIGSSCETCLSHRDLADDCATCEGNWDLDQGCSVCLPGYGPADTCAACLGHRDPATACTTCLLGWGDVDDNDCGTCVRYVDAAAAAGGDGKTWAAAQNTLQGGIYAALQATKTGSGNSTYPDRCEVWASAGTYQPTAGADQARSILLQGVVDVYGGFPAGSSSPGWSDRDFETNVTTIDGAATGGLICHVVTAAAEAAGTLLDGVTIKGGAAGGSDPSPCALATRVFGGGMLVNGVAVTVRNTRFTANSAPGIPAGARGNGGGMAIINNGQVTLTDCQFDNNSAQDSGAGIYAASGSTLNISTATFDTNHIVGGMGGGIGGGALNLKGTTTATIDNTTFNNNATSTGDSSRGGAIRLEQGTLTLSHATFTSNAGQWAGAISMEAAGTLTITDSSFTSNSLRGDASAFGNGGAIYLAAGNTRIARTSLSTNTAGTIRSKGGAIYIESGDLKLTNAVLRNNTASGGPYAQGGGLFVSASATAELYNCTVYGNAASAPSGTPDGGGLYVGDATKLTIINDIIWGNTPIGLNSYPAAASLRARNNTYQDGPISGYSAQGNTQMDPLFVGGTPYDLHLTGSSPAKDGGTPHNATTDVEVPLNDIEGRTRPQGGAWDMGAYEYVP